MASCRCSSFNLSLSSLTWLTYTYGMPCQDDAAPGEYYSTNVYANTNLKVWIIQLVYVYDQ